MEKSMEGLRKLRKILVALRDKETGCPWFQSLKLDALKLPCVEETAEVVCAINETKTSGDSTNLREELGDLLTTTLLMIELCEEENLFTLDDVVASANEKMIRRHPHVFAGEKYDSYEALVERYKEIKRREKEGREPSLVPLFDAFEEVKKLLDLAKERKLRDLP
ncbi:MAG: MazG nucleotide pyrophosphohydrolase domain-containing protein [Thermoguttaceae bacterium]